MPSIQSLLKAQSRTLGREGGGDAGMRNLPLTTAYALLKQILIYIEGTQFCRVETTLLSPGSVPTTPSVSLNIVVPNLSWYGFAKKTYAYKEDSS